MPQYQGVWTLEQQAQAQSNQQWVTDPNFKNTTLLLQADGTGSGSQNNTFLDGSTNNFFITRNGNTTQGSFTPFSQAPGYWGNYQADVSSNYISFTTSPGTLFQFAGDFTVESWVYLSSAATGDSIWVTNDGSANYFALNLNTTTFDIYLNSSSSTNTIPHGLVIGQWSHIAMVRSGSTITLYTNGVAKGTLTNSSTLGYASPSIARNGGGGSNSRYLSNLRIVKGTAVYTSNFTPQTTPLTNITNTSLLTCQSNRFVDNSSNALVATITGTPTVQAFGPFAPALQWTPDVVGGSGYFDGSGDYLSVGSGTDFNLSTSDFMMEFWYYCTALGTYAPGIYAKRVGGAATGWSMQSSGFIALVGGTWYDSWGNPYWVGSTSATGFNASTSLTKVNQWTHVVITRSGTDVRWFVNGQMLGYQSRSGAIDQLTGSTLSIGLGGTTSEQPFTGYISNGRIVIGSVPTGYQTSSTTLNTQIFTPPTTPITTTSQGATSGDVKLLFSSTNAGIYDGKMANNLETVGNAQVATSPVKYGSGSMYFDGTGDWLLTPNGKSFINGTEPFTFECWVYLTGTPNYWTLCGGGSGSFLLTLQTLTTININPYGSGNTLSVTTSLSTNTWIHIAATRNAANKIDIWVNGVSAGSTTSTQSFGSPTYYVIGAADSGGLQSFNGYIDDLRITKAARYISNFTPPQQALPRQ